MHYRGAVLWSDTRTRIPYARSHRKSKDKACIKSNNRVLLTHSVCLYPSTRNKIEPLALSRRGIHGRKQSPLRMASQLLIANLQTLMSCRLCIICAKSTEAIHVKECLNLRTKISGRDVANLSPGARGHDFWLGSMFLNGKCSLSYYITSTSRQGIQSCATETAALFATLRPTYALLVGTCAAMQDQGYEYVTTLILTSWC